MNNKFHYIVLGWQCRLSVSQNKKIICGKRIVANAQLNVNSIYSPFVWLRSCNAYKIMNQHIQGDETQNGQLTTTLWRLETTHHFIFTSCYVRRCSLVSKQKRHYTFLRYVSLLSSLLFCVLLECSVHKAHN